MLPKCGELSPLFSTGDLSPVTLAGIIQERDKSLRESFNSQINISMVPYGSRFSSKFSTSRNACS